MTLRINTAITGKKIQYVVFGSDDIRKVKSRHQQGMWEWLQMTDANYLPLKTQKFENIIC